MRILVRLSSVGPTGRSTQMVSARRGGDVQDELEPIIEDLRGELDDTMSKSQAAKVIGVSVPTLDKWIEQRIVAVKLALVDQLQRDSPANQGECKKLYGPGLRALARGELVSAPQTDAFGPDD